MLQHVPSEFVTAGSFITGAWDTVFKRDTITLQAAVNTWLDFTLDHPFIYNPAQPLAISMEQCSATGTTTGYSLCFTTATGSRRIYSVGGCPFVYSGVSTNIINCGISLVTITGGSTPVTQVPGEYNLGQNYPNPFNPVTKISYDIPKSGFVSLKVYDLLGREIAALVNEVKAPGSYIVELDASAFASGTYFYRLESGNFISTRKMVLIK
ncbi:MAG: T9SS type A sorting domain-containing protein [Ignavibacteriae bacterium]|nr:T9SS type A sorting domain-containing protein [Ignavibacteriota bacterium]